jgi:Ran-binding protein 1
MSALAVESNDPHFEPLVMLDEVAVETGEEQEEALCTLRSKLYVFIKEDVYGGETRNNYWKERGLGDVKILKHKSTGQCRILMRQEKTLKVCANFRVLPESKIAPSTNTKSWVFHAYDTAGVIAGEEGQDGPELLQYAIKFKTEEFANEFKENYELAQKHNSSAPAAAAAATEATDGAKSTAEETSAADLDAAIAARNQAKARRRSVMVAENALADSDYDSDEEEIDEADANEIMKRFNAIKDDSVTDAMSAVKISKEN